MDGHVVRLYYKSPARLRWAVWKRGYEARDIGVTTERKVLDIHALMR